MSPCLEIYGCKHTGRCVIKDDFQSVYDRLSQCQGLILASPIFFYTVSSHTKMLMDRCQSFWVKKYWLQKNATDRRNLIKKGLFISVGATKGKRLFEGALLTVRYFLETLDIGLWRSLLYRGLDFEGDVLKHPEYLEEACTSGRELVEALTPKSQVRPAGALHWRRAPRAYALSLAGYLKTPAVQAAQKRQCKAPEIPKSEAYIEVRRNDEE